LNEVIRSLQLSDARVAIKRLEELIAGDTAQLNDLVTSRGVRLTQQTLRSIGYVTRSGGRLMLFGVKGLASQHFPGFSTTGEAPLPSGRLLILTKE
jgi:16S rRNA G527 N7-methylase RsmG